MSDLKAKSIREQVAEDGGIDEFLARCDREQAQLGTVFHAHGEYDAKTLIRHAMVALEDQMGLNESWRLFNYQLQDIFLGIRRWEDANIGHKQAVAK